MPSFRVSASFILALMQLVSSAAQDMNSTKPTITEADANMLQVALSNGRTYASDVNVFICALEVESVETQKTMEENANDPHNYDFNSQSGTDYSFCVYGCPVSGKEDVGYCPDKAGCSDAGRYHVVVYSQPKNDILKVTAISRHTESDD